MIFFAALILYSLTLLVYAVLAWAVTYHVYAYTAKGDITRTLLLIFIGLSLVFVASSAYYFIRIPWDTLGGGIPAVNSFL